MHAFRLVLTALALAGASATASALPWVVDAKANSSTAGTGLSTISLLAGQAFSVSVDPLDLWSAGALPRWSNADGLIGDLFATGTDESGQAGGTRIGRDFGLQSQGGFSAPYGKLVGAIDGGFFAIGTSYSGVAANAGTLKLFYWDSNASDNSQWITANVSAVPEPGTWALLAAGVGALAFVRRRRA